MLPAIVEPVIVNGPWLATPPPSVMPPNFPLPPTALALFPFTTLSTRCRVPDWL